MINYLLRKHGWQIALAIIVFGSLIFLSLYREKWYDAINWFEAIAGVGTLILATFLWWNDMRKNWEDQLPKKLNAYFTFESYNVLVFKNILLISEGDIRAWAQQIALQKVGEKLSLEPFFRFESLGVQRNANGIPVKVYEITFFLSAIPEKLKTALGYHAESTQKYCFEWEQVEEPNGKVSMSHRHLPVSQMM